MVRSIGEIIEFELSREKEFKGLVLSQIVFEAVRYVLGEGLSSQIKMAGFRNGVAWIKTPNSTFSHELSFFEKEIVERVNSIVGEKVLKSIRFEEMWKKKNFKRKL